MFGVRGRVKAYIDRAVREAHQRAATQESVTTKILADLHGHAKTREARLPVASDGSPLPWYTYPAIEYFNRLQSNSLRIFEYGSGNSSLYWANKGAQVWSVEHDPAWHKAMSAKSSALAGLLLRETAETYAAAIDEVGGEFDMIIIDGGWRNECTARAVDHLKLGGVVILDNSDWYTDVSQFLKDKGFLQIDFNGFGPINEYCWSTSILFQASSVLAGRIAHPRPVGGIEVSKGETW
jgi:hypothetical protein